MKLVRFILFTIGFFATCTANAQIQKATWKVTVPTRVNVTIYQATSAQCDDSPCISASGYNVCTNPLKKLGYLVIAVSQDFINQNKLEYYQIVKLIKDGKTHLAVVVDCMNIRFKNKVDILSKDISLQGEWLLVPTFKFIEA